MKLNITYKLLPTYYYTNKIFKNNSKTFIKNLNKTFLVRVFFKFSKNIIPIKTKI